MILHVTEMGSGPPLVLLHGLFGAGKNLGALARGLSGQARVISMDLRNHGDSGHDTAMDYDVMAADVAATMAAMGVQQARVAGHSMGGKTAMRLALRRPALVERLVVMDIAPVTYRHGYDAYVAAMRAIPLQAELHRLQADAALAAAVPEAPLRAFLLNNLILGAQPRWRIGLEEIAGAMPAIMAWQDTGARYDGPVLFLRGSESDYVLDEYWDGIKRCFPAAVLRTVAGAGHWLHAEKPQQVVAELQRFLFS